MGQSQGQGLGLGQLLPPSSSSSPAILVKTHNESEQKSDGAVPSTPDSVESLNTKLDDAVKPVGWDCSETGKAPSILSSTADVVQSLTAKLEQKSDGDDICWGERRWGVKPTWWDQDVKPTGWEDEQRSDHDVKPTGWEDEQRSDQDVKPTGWEDEQRSDQDVEPTGCEDEQRSDQDVKPTGWEDEVRSDQDVKSTGWEDVERSHQDVKPTGWDQDVKPTGWDQDVKPTGWEDVERSGWDVKPTGWEDEDRSKKALPNHVNCEKGKCPEKPHRVDCSFYVNTGSCKFGLNCRFNHPPQRNKGYKGRSKKGSESTQSSVSRGNKVGTTGKHAHFPVKTEPGPEEMNFLGLPMRPGEMICTHFMRTGSCKYATNCRYHHPNPVPVTEHDTLSGYQNGASPQQHASGASELPMTSFPLPIASCGPLPHPSPPYTPVLYALPTEGFYPCPGWSGYQVPTTPWTPPEMISGNPLASNMSNGYVPTHQAPQIDEYLERPGQPVCHYFTKNGYCKFKSACKFHHPKTVHRAPTH